MWTDGSDPGREPSAEHMAWFGDEWIDEIVIPQCTIARGQATAA
jgi:hypothetical protein